MFSDERPPPNLNPNDPRSPLWADPLIPKVGGLWPQSQETGRDGAPEEAQRPMVVYITVVAVLVGCAVIFFSTI